MRSSSLDFGGANAAGVDTSADACKLRRANLESLCSHSMHRSEYWVEIISAADVSAYNKTAADEYW